MTIAAPRRAIVPAAGKGTRMAAIRGETPKELVPVAGVPMLMYALVDLVRAGIEEICVVIAPGKADIQRVLAQRFETPAVEDPVGAWWPVLERISIHFAVQPEPRGLADAIRCAEPFLGDEPYVCHLPDNVFVGERSATEQIVESFLRVNLPTVALTRVTPETAGGFGNCGKIVTKDIDENTVQICELGDKGTGAFETEGRGWRTCGLSVLTREFLEKNAELEANAKGEWDDVPVLQRLTVEKRLCGRRLRSTCYDVGNPDGYARAATRVTGLPIAP